MEWGAPTCVWRGVRVRIVEIFDTLGCFDLASLTVATKSAIDTTSVERHSKTNFCRSAWNSAEVGKGDDGETKHRLLEPPWNHSMSSYRWDHSPLLTPSTHEGKRCKDITFSRILEIYDLPHVHRLLRGYGWGGGKEEEVREGGSEFVALRGSRSCRLSGQSNQRLKHSCKSQLISTAKCSNFCESVSESAMGLSDQRHSMRARRPFSLYKTLFWRRYTTANRYCAMWCLVTIASIFIAFLSGRIIRWCNAHSVDIKRYCVWLRPSYSQHPFGRTGKWCCWIDRCSMINFASFFPSASTVIEGSILRVVRFSGDVSRWVDRWYRNGQKQRLRCFPWTWN